MKKILLIIISFCTISLLHAQDTTKIAYTNLKLYPVLWQQVAAEYRALCYQAFNTAKMRLDEVPKKRFKKEKLAVITDLDETILDNSYVQAQLVKDGKQMNAIEWINWTNKSAATAVPGAVEFLQYAKQKGATIFYISNRAVGEVPSTLINLKKLQLPDADTSHMLFLSNTPSKEVRRQIVMKNYDVIMLLGDNLNDFMQVFEKKPINERFAETDSVKNDWGNKFIVLPNATYGEWENALFNYNMNLTPEQKTAALIALLKGFDEAQ